MQEGAVVTAGVPQRARRAVVGDAAVPGVHGSSRALRMGCVEQLTLALGADGVDVGLGLLYKSQYQIYQKRENVFYQFRE